MSASHAHISRKKRGPACSMIKTLGGAEQRATAVIIYTAVNDASDDGSGSTRC
jgi:hypothetical protein